MAEWPNRPLDAVYPVIFIDAVHVRIRDGAVANRPNYLAFAVTAEGRRGIPDLWSGDGGKGADRDKIARARARLHRADGGRGSGSLAGFAQAWGRKFRRS
jgi:hypothetical protein